jgi:hypothetical protein
LITDRIFWRRKAIFISVMFASGLSKNKRLDEEPMNGLEFIDTGFSGGDEGRDRR